jgi:signal peptidase I
MSEPAEAGPAAGQPGTGQPGTGQPGTGQRAADGSAGDQPGTGQAAGHAAADGPSGRRRWRRILIETVITLAVAALLAGLVRTYALQTYWIPSGSMEPTLGIYDRILVQKAFFSWHDLHEGDIVVFSHPPLDDCPGPQNGDLVKRVIALPGQTIYSSGNAIYVDGRRLAESYLPAYHPLGRPIASSQDPYRVPSGEFYVLGDNRADSCDSRYWGPITGASIVGKVILLWWHSSHPAFHLY